MESAAIEQQLKVATHRLRTGNLASEADVKQAVIVPILRALGWNTDDNEQLKTEHPVANGFVDYALFRYDQPNVFIEAKRKGKAEDPASRKQLFDYAPNRDIPILVLTDGKLWEFYFGIGPGTWEERCFHQLTLDDDESLPSHASFLTLHLGKEAVVSGKAPIHAHDAFNRNQALERANRALPDCWRGLLSEPHQVLYDLLRERVKAKCGVEPREDDVNRFLTKAATGANWQIHGHREEPLTDSPIPSTPPAATPKSRQRGKTPDGDFRHPILQVLIEMDGSATRRQVLHELTKVMASRLGDYDRETHKDGSIRWEKSAEFEASKMRTEGLLKPVKQKGLWEISDRGRNYWGEGR